LKTIRYRQRSLRQTTLHFSETSFAPHTGQMLSGALAASDASRGGGSLGSGPGVGLRFMWITSSVGLRAASPR
jgi:hypothetical protein